jgi:hypothetical protein
MLRTLRFTPHLESRRQMGELDGTIRNIAVLAPGSRATARFELQIPGIQTHLDCGRHGQNGYRDGTRLNATPFFRRRNPLPPMSSSLIGEDLGSAPAFNSKNEDARAFV